MAGSLFSMPSLYSQNDNFSLGTISGNFQLEAQSYKQDSTIGAKKVDEEVLSQGFLNLNWKIGNVDMGLRYESYFNPLLGIDPQYKGSGIAYRFITYNSEKIDVTVGNFYQQFGSGLIFRSYEEKALGIDNAMEGLRFKLRPSKGLELTGMVGKQRAFWGLGDGIVRGGDLSLNLNDVIGSEIIEGSSINLGASAVSKYQADLQSTYNLPLNVMAYSTRASIAGLSYSVDLEYGYKINDPNATNKFNFNPGYGYLVNSSFFGDGYGLALNFHKTDNMDFRSDRNALLTKLQMSFVPPLTKQHTYRLATVYPYGSQINGEAGVQAEFTYKFKKGTTIGGDYGTNINVNYSRVQNIDTTRIISSKDPKGEFTYDSPLFGIGKRVYFQDFNIEISKKLTKDFKAALTYVNLVYDKDIMEHEGANIEGKVYSNIVVLDMTYNIAKEHTIRTEMQHLWAKQDLEAEESNTTNGNWAMFLAEYTIAPKWFFTVYDEYNYGNHYEANQLHYLNGSIAYTENATRLSVSYGRQRGGILCVGGVCRPVPASNGFYLSLTTSF